MTQDEKNNYLLRFRRFQQSREKFFAPKINAELHKQYMVVVDNINLGEKAVLKIDSGGIATVLKQIYIDAATVYGAKVSADLKKEGVKSSTFEMELKRTGGIGFSERMHQLITDYFRTDILNTSKEITQTTRELITQVFTDAYAAGLGINEIVAKLRNTELSRMRSRLIARTETVTAANQGALFVAKDTGLKLNKVWLATKDKRTRADHVEVDGQKVGRDDYFNVGGNTMLIPGARVQENGLPVEAKEVCNCRCTTIFETIRDANGRLVRA